MGQLPRSSLVLAAMLVNSFFSQPALPAGVGSGKYLFTRPILDGVCKHARADRGRDGDRHRRRRRARRHAACRRIRCCRRTSWFYIWVFRGTPVLVQIFLWFNLAYPVPAPVARHPLRADVRRPRTTNTLISPFTAALLALGLNEAAYMAEIVRAGILSVDEGQTEAASALGHEPQHLIMRRIVLPQAMRVIVPPTGNETISMLKTSVARALHRRSRAVPARRRTSSTAPTSRSRCC